MVMDFLKKYKKRSNYTGTDIPQQAIDDMIAIAESLGYTLSVTQTVNGSEITVGFGVTEISTGDGIISAVYTGPGDINSVFAEIRLYALVVWVDYRNRVDP